MKSSGAHIGRTAVFLLVLLRISIGWHFLYQGYWKLQNPDFSSAGFLGQAKGPLGDYFRSMIPDYDGRARLNQEENRLQMDGYLREFIAYYQLAPEQAVAAEAANAQRQTQLAVFFEEYAEDVQEYLDELARYEEEKTKLPRDLPYAEERIWKKRGELQAQAAPLLAQVQKIRTGYEADLFHLLDADQRELGRYQGAQALLTRVDKLVIVSNIAIGLCLIAGLCTRLAALGGGLFLGSIVAAQPDWPGLYPPPHPSAGHSFIVNKEFVEMIALFALAALPVGRWGGLDFFLYHGIFKPLFGRKQKGKVRQ